MLCELQSDFVAKWVQLRSDFTAKWVMRNSSSFENFLIWCHGWGLLPVLNILLVLISLSHKIAEWLRLQLSAMYRWENRGSEPLSHLAEVTWLISGKAEFKPAGVWLPDLDLGSPSYPVSSAVHPGSCEKKPFHTAAWEATWWGCRIARGKEGREGEESK